MIGFKEYCKILKNKTTAPSHANKSENLSQSKSQVRSQKSEVQNVWNRLLPIYQFSNKETRYKSEKL